MNDIRRIIYVPTLRCNCACKHCGQSRYFKEAESPCSLIYERLMESEARPDVFSITGGEPFLKEDLPEALAKIVNAGGELTDITTNGICVEAITRFVEQVKDASKLLFSVSIDGLPEVHNRIRRNKDAFDRAIESVRVLKAHGVPVKVNTVIQRDNYQDLDSFANCLYERAGFHVDISWIPLISEINGENEFPYTEGEASTVLQRISSAADKAYLLSKGAVKIKGCHAGRKTIVISPSGKVYSCVTGFAYKDVDRRESFLIGDLKTQTFDEIAEVMSDTNAGFQTAVRSCEGCWNPCEVGHEMQYWGMRIDGTEIRSEKDNENEAKDVSNEEMTKGALPSMKDKPEVEVDVEKIMAEIRQKIQMEEDLRTLPAFEDIAISDVCPTPKGSEEKIDWPTLQKALTYINTHYETPYYWPFQGGKAKTLIKRAVRKLNKCLLLPIVQMQNTFHVHVVRCINNLRHGVAELFAQTAELFVKTDELSVQTKSQAKEIDALKAALSEQTERLQALCLLVDQLHDGLIAMGMKIRALDQNPDTTGAGDARTPIAHERPDDERAASQAEPQKGKGTIYQKLDYFKFQNDFRGSQSTIMERQKMYLPYFQNATAPVLDIGCGRGEFLRIMKDHNIPAFGVDLYPEYEVEGELVGLDIRQGDGIAFLQESNERYGGIFACQVIEHIGFDQLQVLCAAAYEKLEPGAYLVLETPNPTCLSMFTNSFYIDPTHSMPVHPLLLEYLLREIGFREIKTVFTDASKMDFTLPKIESDGIKNLAEVNAAIERVSDLLYGSLDYAVIAKR